MTSTVAEIALMYVLPLGVTAVLVMQAAASELLYHRIVGGALSLGVIALDFLFLKGILFSHTTDGGLILSFINLAVLGILFAIRGKYTADFAINIMFSIVMGAGIVGIIFSSHPTLVVSSDYTPEEIAQINAKYQDYQVIQQRWKKENCSNYGICRKNGKYRSCKSRFKRSVKAAP